MTNSAPIHGIAPVSFEKKISDSFIFEAFLALHILAWSSWSFTFRKLMPSDLDEIQMLCLSNPLFYEHLKEHPGLAQLVAMLQALPDSKTAVSGFLWSIMRCRSRTWNLPDQSIVGRSEAAWF